jgi:hypothetical protein
VVLSLSLEGRLDLHPSPGSALVLRYHHRHFFVDFIERIVCYGTYKTYQTFYSRRLVNSRWTDVLGSEDLLNILLIVFLTIESVML